MQGTFALIEILGLVAGIILLLVAVWEVGHGLRLADAFIMSLPGDWSLVAAMVRKLAAVLVLGVPVVWTLVLAGYAFDHRLAPSWFLWTGFGLLFVVVASGLILLSWVAGAVRSLATTLGEGHLTLRRVYPCMATGRRLWAAAFVVGVGAGIARIVLRVLTG